MRKQVVANGRRAMTLAGRAFSMLFRRSSAPASSGKDARAGPQAGHKNALDRLIDGESITVAGSKGEEVGYVIGWTSRKIPVVIRTLLLTKDVPRLELEIWRGIMQDLSREVPDDVTMIFWEGLPLAVWCPAGHLKEFSFNPN
jgi:hypothetical protein